MLRKLFSFNWIGLAAVAVASVSCTPKPFPPLKVVYVEASSNLPFFVALERGYFTKDHLNIEAIKASNSSEAINLLAAGRADISIENNYNVIYAVSGKQPDLLKIVQPCYETKTHPISHLLVKANSKITTPSQLKGKKIGTFSGASQLLVLKLYLQTKLGLNPDKDVTLIQVEMNLQVPSLESGQYNALFTVEPYSTVAIMNGTAKSIDDYVRGEIMNPFPAGATSLRATILGSRKGDVKRFLEILDRAIGDIETEGKSINSVLPKYTPLTAEMASQSEVYEFKTFNGTTPDDEKQALALMKMYVDAGVMPASSLVQGLFLSPAVIGK